VLRVSNREKLSNDSIIAACSEIRVKMGVAVKSLNEVMGISHKLVRELGARSSASRQLRLPMALTVVRVAHANLSKVVKIIGVISDGANDDIVQSYSEIYSKIDSITLAMQDTIELMVDLSDKIEADGSGSSDRARLLSAVNTVKTAHGRLSKTAKTIHAALRHQRDNGEDSYGAVFK